MKKTLLSVATVTTLTGIASADISANEYVPEDVQENHDYTYNHETNGDNYSYYWYYGNVDGSQYADQYSFNSNETAPAQDTYTSEAAPAVSETAAPAVSEEAAPAPEVQAPAAEEYQAPAVQEYQDTEEVQAPAPSGQTQSYGNNWYFDGDCTWYVFEKRQSMGKSVSGSWGDAKNWAGAAASEGYAVNNTPSQGAIMQTGAGQNGAYGQGHVAVVEQVNSDGSIVVSEMNWDGGVGGQTTRTISAGSASQHNFIH